jgi:hypothetical protein
MKLTLFLLGVLFIQLALTLLIAKCIHAGRGPRKTGSLPEPNCTSPAPSLSLIDSVQATIGLAAMAREITAHSGRASKASASSTTAPLSV